MSGREFGLLLRVACVFLAFSTTIYAILDVVLPPLINPLVDFLLITLLAVVIGGALAYWACEPYGSNV